MCRMEFLESFEDALFGLDLADGGVGFAPLWVEGGEDPIFAPPGRVFSKGDSMEPCSHGASTLEVVDCVDGSDKGLLGEVFGGFGVPGEMPE